MINRVFLSFLATWIWIPAVVCAEPSRSTISQNSFQEDLKSSVVAAQAKLGTLDPWQKKIFEEEVIPQYARFVKDYRATQGGTNVEVDLEVLRKYLRFYAPKVLGREAPQLLVELKPETTCAKCMEAEPLIRRLAKMRVERRGFVPVFSGETKEIDLKKIAGTLNMKWRMNPADAAHADESSYQIQSSLIVNEASPAASVAAPAASSPAPGTAEAVPRSYKHEDQLQLLENDSFETAAARLLTDTFTAFGTQVEDVIVTAPGTGEEFTVTLLGIKDYDHYQKLKTRLDTLKDSMTFDERKLSRGRVVFVVRTTKAFPEIKTALTGLSLEPGRLVLTDSDDRSFTMEIQ